MDVVVYGPLRSATGTKRVTLEFAGETVDDALATFVEAYPRAGSQLYADDGTLRASVRVVRDGTQLARTEACSDEDELWLFPAMQGGRS
jgi:molybdopterin synthase sulfur carrier subunit